MDTTTSNNNASSSDERRPPTKRPRISADETVCLDCHDDMLSTSCTNKKLESTSSSSAVVSTEVWGLVCDFLPYDSLLSVAATSRTMLNEVMPLVTMLHINKSTQLHAGIARKRYRDVRDIYIYSLIEYTRDVGFGYPGAKPERLFTHCEFGITSKSRIVLLGENGNGKTVSTYK